MVVSPIGKSRTTPQSRSDAPALRDSGLHASRESDISPGFRSSSGADLAKCGRWGAFRKLGLPTDHTSRPSVPQEGPLDRPLRGQGFRLRLHPRPLRAFQSRSDAPALRDSGLHASRESDISPGFRSSSGADLAKCDRWGAFRKLRLPHRSHLALLCAAGRSRRSASTRTGIPASPPSQTAPGLPAEDVPTHAKNAFGDAATPKRPFSFASSLTLA